jgi:hypothetical protein
LMVVFESQLSPSLPVATGAILDERGGCRYVCSTREPIHSIIQSELISISFLLVWEVRGGYRIQGPGTQPTSLAATVSFEMHTGNEM